MQVQQQWDETQQIPRAPPNTKPNLISFPVSEEFRLLPFCLFQADRLTTDNKWETTIESH